MFKKLVLFFFAMLLFLLQIEASAYKDKFNNESAWVVGADVGYGYLSTQESNLFLPVVNSIPITNPSEINQQRHSIGHWVGSAHLGHVFSITNKLFAGLEIGYRYLGQSKYSSFQYVPTIVNEGLGDGDGESTTQNIRVSQQAIDFLITGKINLNQKLNIFGKIGAAYVNSLTSMSRVDRLTEDGVTGATWLSDHSRIWRIRPEINLGAGYAVSEKFNVYFAYTYIGGTDGNAQGTNRFYPNSSGNADINPGVFVYNALSLGIDYYF